MSDKSREDKVGLGVREPGCVMGKGEAKSAGAGDTGTTHSCTNCLTVTSSITASNVSISRRL